MPDGTHRTAHGPSDAGRIDTFTQAFDNASIGMAVMSLDGRFLRANAALARMLQRPIEELYRTTWRALTHPDDVDVGMALARRMLDDELDAFQLEKRYVLPGGGTIWAMVSVALIRGIHGEPIQMMTHVVDVTARRLADEAQRQLAAIADFSDDAIIGADLEGIINAWNHGARSIFGYSADEAIGRHISLLVPDSRRAEIDALLENLRLTECPVRADATCLPKHGPAIEVAATVSPILGEDGTMVGASIIARDVTEQRWLAKTLDSTLVALEGALEGARASEARSQRFLADAAHQLRTPMTGIRACAEALLRGAPSDQVDQLLIGLIKETTRASRVTNSLLRIAKLDEGQSLEPRACRLVALCKDEAARARALAPHLRIRVQASGLAEERPVLDSHATREILANLLDNARRYAASRIDVVLRSAKGVVEITVADDGIGLPADRVAQAFERFVTLDLKGGSGLGLPIARELARLHGGDLTYEDGRFVARLSTLIGSGGADEPGFGAGPDAGTSPTTRAQ